MTPSSYITLKEYPANRTFTVLRGLDTHVERLSIQSPALAGNTAEGNPTATCSTLNVLPNPDATQSTSSFTYAAGSISSRGVYPLRSSSGNQERGSNDDQQVGHASNAF